MAGSESWSPGTPPPSEEWPLVDVRFCRRRRRLRRYGNRRGLRCRRCESGHRSSHRLPRAPGLGGGVAEPRLRRRHRRLLGLPTPLPCEPTPAPSSSASLLRPLASLPVPSSSAAPRRCAGCRSLAALVLRAVRDEIGRAPDAEGGARATSPRRGRGQCLSPYFGW